MIFPALRKWQLTIKVSWSNLFIYRVNFFLMVIGPMVVFFFIKMSLWSSIFESSQQSEVSGYTLKEMLTYHLWVMIASMITNSSSSSNISEDIRMGKITSYLIYPFSLWEFHTAHYIARQIIQLFIAFITIGLSYQFFADGIVGISAKAIITGVLIALSASFFWYSMNYLIGLLGFWMEETWTLMVMFQIISYFLSGAVVPLDLFPLWLQSILVWSPFPYISYIPAKTFMGVYPDFNSFLIIMFVWISFVLLLITQVWKRGLDLYTGAGM